MPHFTYSLMRSDQEIDRIRLAATRAKRAADLALREVTVKDSNGRKLSVGPGSYAKGVLDTLEWVMGERDQPPDVENGK
jgi:hypothetical protein